MNNDTLKSRLLSVKEAAAYLRLAPRTLYNQCSPSAKRKFPVKPRRIGSRVLFERRELDAYIDSLALD